MPAITKFTNLGRRTFERNLENICRDQPSAKYSLINLRPKLRSLILKIAAGERIHPEIIRTWLGVFVKSAVLRAEVFTIPTKEEGLRTQSSEVHIACSGVGKGLGCT